MFFKNLGISFFKEHLIEAASDYTATKFWKTVDEYFYFLCSLSSIELVLWHWSCTKEKKNHFVLQEKSFPFT